MAHFLNTLAEMALSVTSSKIKPIFASHETNSFVSAKKSANLPSDNIPQLFESPSSSIELAKNIQQQPLAETAAEFSQIVNKELKHMVFPSQGTSTQQSKLENIKNSFRQENLNCPTQPSINADEAGSQEQTETIDKPLPVKPLDKQTSIKPKINFQSGEIAPNQINPNENNQKIAKKNLVQQFNTKPSNEHTKLKSVEQIENNHLPDKQLQQANHLIPQEVSIIHNKTIELQKPKHSTKNISNREAIKERATSAISQDLKLNDFKINKSYLPATDKNALQVPANVNALQGINSSEDLITHKNSFNQIEQTVQSHKNLQLLDTIQVHPNQHFLNSNKLPNTLPKIKITIQRLHIRALSKPKLIAQKKPAQSQSLSLLDYLDQSRQGVSSI